MRDSPKENSLLKKFLALGNSIQKLETDQDLVGDQLRKSLTKAGFDIRFYSLNEEFGIDVFILEKNLVNPDEPNSVKDQKKSYRQCTRFKAIYGGMPILVKQLVLI